MQIQIIFGLKNYPNTNNIRFEKIAPIRIRIIFGPKFLDEYEYEYYSDPKFWTNTNMNNIWVSICGQIRIRIFVIRIIFEYYSNTELFAHLCTRYTRCMKCEEKMICSPGSHSRAVRHFEQPDDRAPPLEHDHRRLSQSKCVCP